MRAGAVPRVAKGLAQVVAQARADRRQLRAVAVLAPAAAAAAQVVSHKQVGLRPQAASPQVAEAAAVTSVEAPEAVPTAAVEVTEVVEEAPSSLVTRRTARLGTRAP